MENIETILFLCGWGIALFLVILSLICSEPKSHQLISMGQCAMGSLGLWQACSMTGDVSGFMNFIKIVLFTIGYMNFYLAFGGAMDAIQWHNRNDIHERNESNESNESNERS